MRVHRWLVVVTAALPAVAGPVATADAADPLGVSVKGGRSITLENAAELESTVVPPGKKAECPHGRVLISNNDVGPKLAKIALVDLDDIPDFGVSLGSAELPDPGVAKLDPVSALGHDPDDVGIWSPDGDLLTLPNGNVLLVKMGRSRAALDPSPAWFDHAYKPPGAESPAWGPGARSMLFVWRSRDCGANFTLVSAIDTAAIDDGYGSPGDGSGALPQGDASYDPPGSPRQPFWQMGGTDGPLARVDPTSGRVYVTIGLFGFLPDPSKPFFAVHPRGCEDYMPAGECRLNRTVVMRSADSGETWQRRALVCGTFWRLDVVPRAGNTLAFADWGAGEAILRPSYSMGPLQPCSPTAKAWIVAPVKTANGPNHEEVVLTRSPSSHNLLMAYEDGAMKGGQGRGYRLYLYDGAWTSLGAVAPTPGNAMNYIRNLTAVDPGRGPVLLYWYDIDEPAQRAVVRARIVATDRAATLDFPISRRGGHANSFDVSDQRYGHYHTAGGYAESAAIHHYYPVWVQTVTGTVRVAHVRYRKPRRLQKASFARSRGRARGAGYRIVSRKDRITASRRIDSSRLRPREPVDRELR